MRDEIDNKDQRLALVEILVKAIEVNYKHHYTHELPMTDGATVSAFAMMMVDCIQRLLGKGNKDWTLEIVGGGITFGFKRPVDYKIHVEITEALRARVRGGVEGDSGGLTDEEDE